MSLTLEGAWLGGWRANSAEAGPSRSVTVTAPSQDQKRMAKA